MRQANPSSGLFRSKGGCAPGDLATYRLVNGGTVKLLVLGVEKDGDYARIRARVTSPTRYGYARGEILNLRDSAFITRRARDGEPPTHLILSAMSTPGRTFVWHDAYGCGWTSSDRPPWNTTFWIVNGRTGH